MSGEETLAQVYREVESPKLKNFKRAALVVFHLQFALHVAHQLLRRHDRSGRCRGLRKYANNLIGGLAMNVVGPDWARLGLNAFVVFVGFLILSGAVNTAIVGSNGVLNRVSEDGVLPDWFLKPHPRYRHFLAADQPVADSRSSRFVFSRGNVLTLGEAYAFGVVWSFVFMALSMLVFRFKQPGRNASTRCR